MNYPMIAVYVGDYGHYRVPDEVVKQAEQMSGLRSINDQRTKGAKLINRWGRNQDSIEMTKAALKQHYGI